MRDLQKLIEVYSKIIASKDTSAMRELAQTDMFFLLTIVLRRRDALHQWILDRCDEYQKDPWDRLDLWARGHYKSTIGTFTHTIFCILNDSNERICIISHDRPNAKKFLTQIKTEFEKNTILHKLFPDIFWLKPKTEAERWSEDSGIVVKRTTNARESTVEGWGIDALPTGAHYTIIKYDDIVEEDSANSLVIRAQVIRNLTMSSGLECIEGTRKGFIGTPYNRGDAYAYMIEKGIASPRLYPAEVNGKPVLLSEEQLAKRKISMGPYTYASQMLMDPKADAIVRFTAEQILRYSGTIQGKTNTYIVVDGASSKKQSADFTALWVISLAQDQNYYVRHFVRDRLSLEERINLVFECHRRFKPLVVGYEQYGSMADVEAIRMEMDRVGYRFHITPLSGPQHKAERIGKLVPIVVKGRLFFPNSMMAQLKYLDNAYQDVLDLFFKEEWLEWSPVNTSKHDDGLDALSRILDSTLCAVFPAEGNLDSDVTEPVSGKVVSLDKIRQNRLGWMAA